MESIKSHIFEFAWLKHFVIVKQQSILGYKGPLGRLVLGSSSFLPETKWYWISIGALLGYVLLFNVLYTICLTFLTRELLKKANFFISKIYSLK